jgi:Icc-related predicted phosphoesterase
MNMKISYCSDLHLEFSDCNLENIDASDVLVLAGDICVAAHLKDVPFSDPESFNPLFRSCFYRNFFEDVSKKWKNIIMVMGNHEHYGGVITETADILRKNLKLISNNIHVLDSNTLIFDDVVFVGTTLWTDLNKEDPMSVYHVRHAMNDYRLILKPYDLGFKQIIPQDTIDIFDNNFGYLKAVVQNSKEKTVIVTHHAPSSLSINEKFKDDTLMNGAYYSDLSDFILGNEHIELWIHGHMHDSVEYQLGETKVVCNPGGYPGQNNFKLKTVVI